ncbi:uncharacterized protein [Rutidosis leptorrhynchoides]|uniref:uncharacterized protein n=1 Tax=Rutidosis leptorrhynchoides TaxID=125765 RepID=UPI003A99E3CB
MLNNELTNPSVRIKVFSVWNKNYWTSPNVLASIEMVFIDSEGNKIAATISKRLIALFRRTFIEGSFLDLSDFGVVPYEEQNYRMAANKWKVLGQLVENSPVEIKWDKGSAKKSITLYLRDLAYGKPVLKANLTSEVLPPVNKDDLILSTNEIFKARKFNDVSKVIMADAHLIQEVKSFVMRGKVDMICDGDGWFGFHCQQCKKKVQQMYCLNQDKLDYFCTKCDKEVTDVTPKYV